MSLTVLIVDSKFSNAKRLETVLAENGHRPFCIHGQGQQPNLFEVADHARWMRFDVAVVDVELRPGSVDFGLLAASIIKLMSPITRVFLIGEDLSSGDADSVRKNGFDPNAVLPLSRPKSILEKLDECERLGPLTVSEEEIPRGSTAEILEWRARCLERRAALLDLIDKKIRQRAIDGSVQEIRDEDIPF